MFILVYRFKIQNIRLFNLNYYLIGKITKFKLLIATNIQRKKNVEQLSSHIDQT